MTPTTSAAVRRSDWRREPGPPTLPSDPDSPAAAAPAGSGVVVPAYAPVSAEQTLTSLALEAARLLRQRLRSAGRLPRPPRVPVADRLTRLRVVLLALTAVMSLTLTWLVTDTALEHRLRLTDAATGASPAEVSLEQRARARALEAAPARSGTAAHRARGGQPGTARGGVERGGAPPSAGGGGMELGGPVLALLGGGGTLTAGAVVGWLLLRRPRPWEEVGRGDATSGADGWTLEVERPEPGEGSPQDGEERSAEALGAAPAEPPPGEDAATAAGDAPRGRDDLPAGDGVPRDAEVVATAGRSGPARPRAVPRLDEDEGLDPALAAARQRLYEKRRAPRLPVDLEGSLTWLGSAWPVTVVEISEGGVRVTAPARPSVGGRRSPLSSGDQVRVSFPGVSGPVRVAGLVAWQRSGPAGFETGLQLVQPSGQDLERLQELCTVAALTAQLRQGQPGRV